MVITFNYVYIIFKQIIQDMLHSKICLKSLY